MDNPRDKTGREILVGDLVKVFHFVGARRKKHYMYKYVAEAHSTKLYLNHLHPHSLDDGYYIQKDGKVLEDYEIVQGYGFSGESPFEERKKII